VILAVLALLAVLAARAAAGPIGSVGEAIAEPLDAGDPNDPADEDDPVYDVPDVGLPRLPRVAAVELASVTAPPAAAVVAAAYRAAGLAHDPAPSWRRRTRLAGLVPAVTVRDGRDAAWRDISDPTIAYVSVFSVAAQWHLERLVFDANELRISAIEAGRRRDRRRVAAVVIRTYYTWLQLRAAAPRDPRWALRADEAAAELDALTDGWFTQNLPATPSAGHADAR
jgi:hypothetical protein